MTDVFTPEKRSQIMRSVKGKGTKPEMAVRQAIRALGYRYKLHVKSLPGVPDMVFPSLRKVVFVHGCFWHRHRCKEGRSMPASRIKYWHSKFEHNKQRDKNNRRRLRRLGWRVFTVWECQTLRSQLTKLRSRLSVFLTSK